MGEAGHRIVVARATVRLRLKRGYRKIESALAGLMQFAVGRELARAWESAGKRAAYRGTFWFAHLRGDSSSIA
jgi:hypothetical protein